MRASLSSASVSQDGIGRVFTPLEWAEWCIDRFGLLDAWRKGATFFDPTCGQGAFLEAFVSLSRKRGMRVDSTHLSKLFGNEICEDDKYRFLSQMKARYGLDFPEKNFFVSDFIRFEQPLEVDFLLGNPPWANFVDLPEPYKDFIKPYFLSYSLVTTAKDVLLGRSRVDFAALILKKALKENLKRGGRAYFFLPLSLFLNDGANEGFRPSKTATEGYAVEELYDFRDERVFEGVATRYGFAVFHGGSAQTFPIKAWERADHQGWAPRWASPMQVGSRGPWMISASSDELEEVGLLRVKAKPHQKPRQGMNTCGANKVFIFDEMKKLDSRRAEFVNALGEAAVLPLAYVSPLMNGDLWRHGDMKERRWVLVAHDRRSGKPLDERTLSANEEIWQYLCRHRKTLQSRKGTMIQGYIRRGMWWALLGVGPYSFYPWKVAWEALGRKSFKPIVLQGKWQGNQAMHAYAACTSRAEAEELCEKLRSMPIERALAMSQMAGTCNWAQPGRVTRLMDFEDNDLFARRAAS